jgi:hypothetical protein
MEIAAVKVDHPTAMRVLDIGITNVPLVRDGPIEY